MKTLLRPRYYCDFCKKSGASSGAMARHERACTANPGRVCSHCNIAGLSQKPIGELLDAIRADLTADRRESDGLIEIPTLKEAADWCPVCIIAAIRQSKSIEGFKFDYKSAHQEFWSNENDAREFRGSGGVY